MELLGKRLTDYRNILVFIILTLILFSFYVVRADSSFDSVTKTIPAEVPVALLNGDVIRHDIPKSITEISSIQIQFIRYDQLLFE